MTLVSYNGEAAAVAGATRLFLAPRLELLPAGDPIVVFVAFMCMYAKQVRDGELPGPYSDDRAAFFARCALIDDDEFTRLDASDGGDVLLAGHFNVPMEQVAQKRADLALQG